MLKVSSWYGIKDATIQKEFIGIMFEISSLSLALCGKGLFCI